MSAPGWRAAEEAAGAVLAVGISGPELLPGEAEALDALRPAGVILFSRNVASAPQVRRLVSAVRDRLGDALVLIDQEGGRVDRLRAIRGRSPSARELAAAGPAAVRAEADRTAAALRDLGVNFNCAPVVDLDEGHEANGIGDRSFGADAGDVAALAGEVLDAHAAAGILACLKHFPGLGRTGADTHAVRPTVSATRAELWERDVVPFRLLAARAPAVMISHAAFTGIEAGDEPGSSSRPLIEGLLRRDLGYDGVVVSDDMEMGAVTDRPPGERARAAVAAGVDLLLFCSDLEQARAARDGLVDAVATGGLLEGRLLEAARRVRGLRHGVV